MILDAIGLVSQNLEKSQKFYKNFDIEFSQVGGADHLEAALPNGIRLMLDSEELIKQLHPDWRRSPNSNVVLCFKKEKAEEVNKLFSELKEEGFQTKTEPWDAFWGQRYCSVLDPDGNQVDIFSDL